MGLLLSGAQDHHGQKVSSINRDRLCPLLSDDQIRRLDAATAIALDYPHNLNRTKRNQKMNGCCRITPEWVGISYLVGIMEGLPVIRPRPGRELFRPTYGHPFGRAQSRVVFVAGQPKVDYKFAPKANRRPSQSRA